MVISSVVRSDKNRAFGENVMVWGCFWFSKVNCIMRKELEGNIRQSTEKLGLGQQWTFQQDIDLKIKAKVDKKVLDLGGN